MNVSSPEKAADRKRYSAVAEATLVWWIIPVLIPFLPRDDGRAATVVLICLLALGLGLGVCALFRRSFWVVVVWMPIFIWSALGAVMVLDRIAREPHGGPDAAPLEGVATLLGLIVVSILACAAVLALVWRPRVYSVPLVLLAIANTAAVSYVTRQVNYISSRQNIAVHIIDRNGKPVPGASVHWTRYSYGPGGKNVFDGDGGPLVSGEDGIVTLPSRRMRYEMKGIVSKTGFRDVLFTVGMQFNKWGNSRDLIISTQATPNIARARIPTTEPIAFSVYLPPTSDAPQPLRSLRPERKLSGTERLQTFLNVESGQFADTPSDSDVEFEIFFEKEGQYERTRLRMTGINGTELQVIPYEVSLTGKLSPYENVFLVAPETGYTNTALVPVDHSPGPQIYLRVRNGKFFARAEVDAYGRADEHSANLYVQLFINAAGSRLLEGPRR
ncbi:hypothetical protein ACXR0O_20810 [Verrucomicrobiota bacterium sgz303538]